LQLLDALNQIKQLAPVVGRLDAEGLKVLRVELGQGGGGDNPRRLKGRDSVAQADLLQPLPDQHHSFGFSSWKLSLSLDFSRVRSVPQWNASSLLIDMKAMNATMSVSLDSAAGNDGFEKKYQK
jgi:hypothetical protein